MSGKKVWIVGRVRAQTDEGIVWTFEGIFNSEEKAVAACRDVLYFIGPAEVDEVLPHEVVDWPGAYYPMAGHEVK